DELMTVTTTGAGKFQFFRDLGDIQVDAVRTEWIVTDMRGGNDRYDASAQTDAAVRVNVKGGHGNDIMTGGAGNDLMTGGGGDDLFRFVKTASGVDTIVDFTKGDDHIDLRAIDANVGAGGNQAFTFIGSAGFSAAGQVRVVDLGATRLIQANTDHDAAAELQIRLADIHLGSADFLL
ncbi:MAG TPA: M10 family metallopeptidase C-terminal domain-containing protein, partial [Geminicoccaceae bacterium]|nr:M10 family metallopeptidase C-terminal domain-containing protein [Geminicoccaceae bacterium]